MKSRLLSVVFTLATSALLFGLVFFMAMRSSDRDGVDNLLRRAGIRTGIASILTESAPTKREDRGAKLGEECDYSFKTVRCGAGLYCDKAGQRMQKMSKGRFGTMGRCVEVAMPEGQSVEESMERPAEEVSE